MVPGRYMQIEWDKEFEAMAAEKRMQRQFVFELCRRMKRKLSDAAPEVPMV